MKRKNMISMVTSLALVGVVAVGGTLALLSQKANDVENTFTVGQGYEAADIKLSEADVVQETDGSYTALQDTTRAETPEAGYVLTINGQKRFNSNNYANLVDGTTIDKDPIVTVDANTVDSWVVAYIDNVDAAFIGSEFQSDNNLWYKVTESGGNWDVAENPVANDTIVKGYYIYKTVVEKSAAVWHSPALFTELNVTIAEDDTDVTTMNVKAGLVQFVGTEKDATKLDQTEINTVMNAAADKVK